MADWLKEGTAHRTRVRIDPVRHLLVQDRPGVWVLWCSSGKGRIDSNPHCDKFHSECVALARKAIAEGNLTASDVCGWPVRLFEPPARRSGKPGRPEGGTP